MTLRLSLILAFAAALAGCATSPTGQNQLLLFPDSEMARMGAALGANPLTFLGLAGVGDLTLTCTGELSRNRQLGLQLAAGRTAREIVASQQAIDG